HPPWHDLITQCFQSTNFMALATQGVKGLWVNPVFFAWDDQFNIYFISQFNCTHMDNIRSNADVVCTIFPTNQDGDVFGAYMTGTADILDTDDDDKRLADDVYYGRVYPDDADRKKRQSDGYRIDPTWHFVRIKPTGLWYFDTR